MLCVLVLCGMKFSAALVNVISLLRFHWMIEQPQEISWTSQSSLSTHWSLLVFFKTLLIRICSNCSLRDLKLVIDIETCFYILVFLHLMHNLAHSRQFLLINGQAYHSIIIFCDDFRMICLYLIQRWASDCCELNTILLSSFGTHGHTVPTHCYKTVHDHYWFTSFLKEI